MVRSIVLVVPLATMLAGSANAATFAVGSTADAVDAAPGNGLCGTAGGTCTLRAAIQEANALAGADMITLPPGTYALMIRGGNEDAAATGDLDVTDDLTLTGSTTGHTVVSGAGVDRAFDVLPGAALALSRITIQSGNAVGVAARGGGIRNAGTLTLNNVAIRGNTAPTGEGGGIANLTGGEVDLTNVTLSGNVAAAQGGGVANDTGGTVRLLNVTLSGNSAQFGGSALQNFGMAFLRNTIVASGQFIGNCTGAIVTSLGNNIDDGASCFFDAANDLPETNPRLAPLQDNGVTFTHPLMPGSPAIDAGDNDHCPPTDQRGALRPADGNNDGTFGCDIGAYEAPGPVAFTPTTTSTPTRTVEPPTPSPTDTPVPPTTTSTPVSPTTTSTPVSPTTTSTPVPPTSTPGGASITLGMAIGSPGDQVEISAILDSGGATVVGTQNDIAFDSTSTPIAALDGAPDCTLNPDIEKQKLFVFRPAGCSGTSCIAIRAAAVPSFPITTIPDGSLLYTCRVNIDPDAEFGEYPLRISTVVLSDPASRPIPGATGVDGKVAVVPRATETPSPSPSSTPTETELPTTTETPAPSTTPTPTKTPIICSGDCTEGGIVTVQEVITLVNITLDHAPITACPAGDLDGNDAITVDEIIVAVNNVLRGCPLAVGR
jgi:CSLREA domain-containing protein